MKKKSIRFVTLILVLFAALSALTLVLPSNEFSENENRYLTQFPQVSWDRIVSGAFQSELSDYLSDQIPGRDRWIQINTAVKKFLGKKEINGIYLGKDGYYFQQFTDSSFSENRISAVFALIDQFAKKQQIPVNLMIVPTPGAVLSEKLPANAPFYDADAMWERLRQSAPSCGFIDLRQSFADAPNKGELYYRTDHHWTAQGAYLAYKNFCNAAGTEVKALDAFELTKVTDSFYGTLHSKVLDTGATPDAMYAPSALPQVTVTVDGKTVSASVYDNAFLDKKDKYAYFFGGNWGTVEIRTQQNNGKRLLILKDSFANSFVPYLLDEYETITMVDLRYYGGLVSQAIEQSSATEVLLLYEMTNLLTDTGINKLGR